MSTTDSQVAPDHNAKRLLFAGFMAILAAGVGFAVRGGIFGNWAADFGFTGAQLGAIGGAGFTGFCFGIIIAGVVVDKLGYGKMIIACFALHVISAFVTFGATKGQPQDVAYMWLFWGMFLFAMANGGLEGVANPLVSTLFPQDRTHYLNILHSSWPAGLVLGGVIGSTLGSGPDAMSWKVQLGLYLIPVVIYGVLFMGQKFPKSEAAQKNLPFGEMLKDIGLLGGLVVCALLAMFFSEDVFGALLKSSKTAAILGWGLGGALLLVVGLLTSFTVGAVLLFVLFIVHALVGSVELGTDGWIQNITGNILTPQQGKILFIFTSTVMFCLRFSAHFIEKTLKLSPVGLLLICASLAVVGLNLASGIETFAGAMVALFVYALGKTFFWPTMLAIVGDRFPRSGAIAMSVMGGIGMMSVGLLGGPGLGYAKDRFTAEALQAANSEAYTAYKADKPSSFLIFSDVTGLDGSKLAAAQKKVSDFDEQKKLVANGGKIDGTPAAEPTAVERAVATSSITGDRRTLTADSCIPAAMALIYLLILLYFKSVGGYKKVSLLDDAK